MSNENVRERDLVLTPNEFALFQDETKGHVIAYVGPHKTSLANTDRPVAFDESTRRYRRCSLEEAIRPCPYAEEGWYVVLENPAPEGADEHPRSGPNSTVKLTWGRKVNTPGPITFPLWPGQVARVIQGHHLRSNQYLLVKVYNEEAARENWTRAVVKLQKDEASLQLPDLTLVQRRKLCEVPHGSSSLRGAQRGETQGNRGIPQRFEHQEKQQQGLDRVQESELRRSANQRTQELEMADRAMQQRLTELAAQVRATVDRAEAITPDLIAALQSFADQALAGKMAESMAPLAILGGKSVRDVLQQLLRGTGLDTAIATRAALKS